MIRLIWDWLFGKPELSPVPPPQTDHYRELELRVSSLVAEVDVLEFYRTNNHLQTARNYLVDAYLELMRASEDWRRENSDRPGAA